MQTFLTSPSFMESARVLDNKRLGKQRVEAKQIYLSITVPTYGWKNHPAVKMWKESPGALAIYASFICKEWINRGFKDSLLPYFENIINTRALGTAPWWLGNKELHASHRSNLLRKAPEWYNKFGWEESDTLPYYWPV